MGRMMHYLLIVYFSASAWGADVANEFPDKATCYAALQEVKSRPEKYHIAYCKPLVEERSGL
jgi:hypothetical protein